ncbi:MAG TPA: MFS transporter [Ktedonosporobacter sp.]|nr:MFS transporter [Ktedonosporobacter sp.]
MQTYQTSFPRASIWLSFSGFLLVGLGGGAGGVLLPSLGAFYHQGDAVLGTLFLVSALSYTISSLSCGPLAARLGLHWLLALGTGVLLVGFLGFILELPFSFLYVARLCYGVGIGIIETGFNIYLSSLPKRTTLLNNLHAFYGVGALLGPLLATGMLSLLFGWNMIYVVLAILNLLLLGSVLFIMRQPVSAQASRQEQKPTREKNLLGAALALPLLWIVSFFLLIYSGVEVCAGSWGYNYLLGMRALSPFVAGWMISGFGLGLTLGRFVIQPLSERLGVGLATLMFALIGSALLSLLLIWLLPFSLGSGLAFSLLGLSLAPIYPVTVALVPRLVPARLEASAIGVLVGVSISGLAFLPWLAGVLAQFQGIWTLPPYLLILSLILLGFWLYLARPVSASEARRKELGSAETGVAQAE